MRFHVAYLVGACVAALLACSAHATQLEARADLRALLRNSVRSEMDVAVAKFSFKKATKVVVDNVGAPVAKVIGKMDSYVDNQLVKDLTIAGNKIKDALEKIVCNNDAGMFAVTLSCSVALQAAICSATKGAAPGCLPGDEVFTLTQRILISLGLSTVSLVFRCTYFHILRQIEGLCEGRAYGIAMQVANAVVADPYSVACSLTVGCSCGPSSCSFSCANDPAVCHSKTYTDAVKAFLNLID
jgi:hypothetical protein